jgi:hypothetical protein
MRWIDQYLAELPPPTATPAAPVPPASKPPCSSTANDLYYMAAVDGSSSAVANPDVMLTRYGVPVESDQPVVQLPATLVLFGRRPLFGR